MAIPITSSFKVNTNLPIEERMIVQTIAERNALPDNIRFDGMITYVRADKKGYQLRGGITNADWVNANLILPEEIGAYDKQEVDDLITAKLTDKAYVDAHIADTVKHITPAERTSWNNKLDKAGNIAQDVALKQLTVHGNILPGKDNLDIGSPTQRFRGIYVDEAYLSTHTLYLGDTPILGTDADTVNIKTDPDQSICMKTSATGTTTVTSEKAVAITTSGMNSNVTIQTTGVNSQANIAATARINLDAPEINLAGSANITGDLTARNLNITGDFTVGGTLTTVNATNLEISDNIIDINKGETGQGVAEGLAGIKIDRGDLNDVLLVFDEVDDKFKVGDSANLLALATEKYVYDNRYIHPAGTNPHGTTKADVGLGNVTNESKATMFTSPSFTGTPVAPTAADNNNSTQLATTAYVMRESAKKANASHGVHIPTPETANARKFLRNDNSWQALPDASTANTGLVKLNDAVNSDSLTEAATAHAVKVTYDLASSKANTTLVTPTAHGLMSKEDKTKLDDIAPNANNYVHPSVHPASMITESTTKRFITDTERNTWNAKSDKSYVDATFLKLTGGTLTGTLHTKSDLQVYSADSSPVEFMMSRRAAGNRSWKFNVTNGDFRLYNKLTEDADWEETLKIPTSDRGNIYIKGQKIYHTGAKPTLSELGAASSGHLHDDRYLQLTGGTVTGTVQANIFRAKEALILTHDNDATQERFKFDYNTGNGRLDILSYNGTEWANRLSLPDRRTPDTHDILVNGRYKLYHEANKPTAQDVQALPITGGTLTGDLTVNMKLFSSSLTGNNKQLIAGNAGVIYVGNPNTPINIESSVNPKVQVGVAQYTMYHTGNKPTLAELGASASSHLHDDRYLALAGGTVSGPLVVLGTAASESFKVRGIQGVSETGTINDALYLNYNTDKPVYINGTNKVYHEGFRPTPEGIGAEPAFAKNTAFNKNFAGTGTATTVARSDHEHTVIASRGRVTAESGSTPIVVKGLSMSEAYGAQATSGYPVYGNILNMKDSNNNPDGACNQLLMGWSTSSTTSNSVHAGVYVRSRRDVAGIPWTSWAQVYTTAYKPTKSDVGLANVGNYAIATTAEAQAGTSNTTYMTPLRVKEAVSILAPADHNHDNTYLKMSGGTMTGVIEKYVNNGNFDLIKFGHAPGDTTASWAIAYQGSTSDADGNELQFKSTTGTIYELDHLGNLEFVKGANRYKYYNQNFKPTKADVGLANVDNTSDLNKPISTATQTALNTKETPSGAQAKADKALLDSKAYTDTKVGEILDSAPEALDTLKELSEALGNDPNFATTVMTEIGKKSDKTYVDSTFLKLAGGTVSGNLTINGTLTTNVVSMRLGEGLHFLSEENYFGTNLDARIIRATDGNGTTVDGGIIFEGHGTNAGTVTRTEWLRLRHDEFKWKGNKIYHAGDKPTLSELGAAPTVHNHHTDYYTKTEINDRNRVKIRDTRADNTTPLALPSYAIEFDFKSRDAINSAPGTSSYSGVMSLKPWGNNSGSNTYQLAFSGEGNTMPRLGIRASMPELTTWGTWYEIYHTGKKPTKADVGLSNVDNTSDANKPISTATQTALNGKANSSHDHSVVGVSTVKLYPENNNEINFGGSNTGNEIYIGYKAKDSRPIPATFIFGGTGTATLKAGNVQIGGNNVYHTGRKPTLTELGAASTAVATSSANGLMSKEDKAKLDKVGDIITLTKTLTLTTEWQDVGIKGTDLENGSYIIQVSGMNSSATDMWGEILTGVMSWYNGGTNNGSADEVLLHKAGHAPASGSPSNHIYVRTLRQNSTANGLKLQVCYTKNCTASTPLTFKFRKLI